MNVGTIRDALGHARRFLIVELAMAAAMLSAGFAGILPLGATPFLLVLGVISLWLRGEGAGGVGLDRRSNWSRSVLFGLAVGIAYQALSLYFVEPILARWIGGLPDVSLFGPLVGNTRFLWFSLVAAWTVAAFGEELVYRGYLMKRIAQVAGGTSRGWLAGLISTSILFGLGHLYQGTAGVVTTGVNGLAFGALYLAGRRNLWIPIAAHGAMDTVGFLLIFFGRYPGM